MLFDSCCIVSHIFLTIVFHHFPAPISSNLWPDTTTTNHYHRHYHSHRHYHRPTTTLTIIDTTTTTTTTTITYVVQLNEQLMKVTCTRAFFMWFSSGWFVLTAVINLESLIKNRVFRTNSKTKKLKF